MSSGSVEGSGKFNAVGPAALGTVISRVVDVSEHGKKFRESHAESDVDFEPYSQHHTLGTSTNQAMPGSLFEDIMAGINEAKQDAADALAAAIAAASAGVPVGTIIEWATGTVPNCYMFLKGGNISRVAYAELFALWGTTHGVGDGVTTFGIPDSRHRLIRGALTVPGAIVNDGLAVASRLATMSHAHDHPGSTFATVANNTGFVNLTHVHSAVTDPGGSHSHAIATDGAHNHGSLTGSASLTSQTNTTATGAATRLSGPTIHDHSIATDGGHSHGALTGGAAGHQHTVTVTSAPTVSLNHQHSIPALTVSFVIANVGSLDHAFITFAALVRYTAVPGAPGVP